MNYQKLEELAQQIRSGQLRGASAFQALADWTLAEGAAANVIHFLHHYVADEDIRESDMNYSVYQAARLDELLTSLASTAADQASQTQKPPVPRC